MASTFGLYRKRCGAKIVKSSYDFDTGMIGPYAVPINLPYVPESEGNAMFHEYNYYQALLQDDAAIAVFNLNNYCLCVLTHTQLYQTVLQVDTKLELMTWNFRSPIVKANYQHIGYIRSYHDCLAVSQYPTYLIREVNSQLAEDFTTPIVGKPMIDPPLALYKELLNNEAEAIYYDLVDLEPKLLFK